MLTDQEYDANEQGVAAYRNGMDISAHQYTGKLRRAFEDGWLYAAEVDADAVLSRFEKSRQARRKPKFSRQLSLFPEPAPINQHVSAREIIDTKPTTLIDGPLVRQTRIQAKVFVKAQTPQDVINWKVAGAIMALAFIILTAVLSMGHRRNSTPEEAFRDYQEFIYDERRR